MDADMPRADAIAVWGGEILAVGDLATVRAEATAKVGPNFLEYDLGGATILPGFIDAHTHVEMIALSRHLWIDVRDLTSPEAIVERLTKRAADLPKGEWAIGQGTFGQELPTKAQLDAAFPDRAVAVRWTMHKYVVNQAALETSGIDELTTAPPGARIQRDEQGHLNGVLEEAWDLLAIPPYTKERLELAIQESLRELFLKNGVTTVHEIGCTAEGLQAMQVLARTHEIPRLGVLLTARPGHQPLIDATKNTARVLGGQLGDDRYWIQGIKVFMDGGRDGAFRSEDLNAPADGWGLLTRLYPTLVEELVAAVRAGMQVCTHAIGDLAQEIAVSAIERVHQLFPEIDHRLRIEHFFNESFGTKHLERLVAAGGIAVPNPGFVFAEPDDPAKRQPPGAAKFSLRTLNRIQGRIPGNSDTAGAQPFTTNPWFTMQCMLQLTNKNGIEVSPGETVDVQTALKAFTVDAAYATMQETKKGRLAPGYFADLAVVDSDPFELATEDFAGVQTLATIVGGDVVHGSLSARAAAPSGEGQ
ncbi:amidohydrolase [Leucobacter denitrificans]|uniref:Amidohydrolase n=1 Tax=Leucobacter denitrificans TaxID=683042 RepID=A0A7G9S228_9MICO|nr:amidohydrolase [Leucobacter denitrificans]QNN61903.1 amidohydrolase [Leucobacter denitrificans]